MTVPLSYLLYRAQATRSIPEIEYFMDSHWVVRRLLCSVTLLSVVDHYLHLECWARGASRPG